MADESNYFGKEMQTINEIIRSAAFSNRVEELGHYDFKESGKILYTQI